MKRAIGIDIGGTKLAVGVVDAEGGLTHLDRFSTPGGSTLVSDITAAVRAVDAEVGEQLAVGIGAAGLVTADGVVRAAPNLSGVSELPLRSLVAEAIGRPVVVLNDNTAATFAEWTVGSGSGATDMVYVGLGTGIGGGAIVAGQLQLGHHGFAGEFGHMVVDPNGPDCVCGRRGCWERVASGSGLRWLAEQARLPLAAAEDVVAAAARHDAAALGVVRDFARWVAIGLVNLVNAYDPAVVVIGGGVSDAGPVVLDPIRIWFAELLYAPEHRPHPMLVAARLGGSASVVGAGLAAIGDGRSAVS
jgi:glucokinase